MATIKIGDNFFDIPTPGAVETFGLQQRIIPIAGRIVGVFFQVLGLSPDASISTLAEMDIVQVLPKALPYLGEVFAAMPPGELEFLTRKLLAKGTFGKGLPLFGGPAGDAIDALLAGRTVDMWRLLWHALEVWYPDFFTRARGFFASAAKKESPSEVSTT